MPTTLGPAFPPDYGGLPTHMSTEDSRIWAYYQPRIAADATALYFDVRLGGQRALDDAGPGPLSNMWYSVNAKRADVLAVMPAGLWLIELRAAAQANAIGRLLTYKLLWERDPKLPGPLSLHLVTDTWDPDVRDIADAYGITYTVVP